MSDCVKKLVRPEVQALSSYHVPDSKGFLKLDAMENPHVWPGELSDAWMKAISDVQVNRYPDPSARELRAALGELMGVNELSQATGEDIEIMLGNGSDELIQIVAMAVATSERGVMAPEPGFVMYDMIARFLGVPYKGVPLTENFELDSAVFVEEMKRFNPAVVFLAVPNNPTGNVFELSEIQAVIEACSGLVVLDEAYLAFTDSDLLEMCAHYDNVVVMRTLSKVGLAGLRLGFLIGKKDWVVEFDKLRLPYNINVLTQASATFAIENFPVLKAQTDTLRNERSSLFNELVVHPLLEPFESEANFILVKVIERSAREVFEQLKNKGVLIKCLDGAHPMLANCLRLTVGTHNENEKMVQALNEVLGQ